MTTAAEPRVVYHTQRMLEDVAARGWSRRMFASHAGVSPMTVIRFLKGERQTPTVAGILARTLGHDVERYIVRQGA